MVETGENLFCIKLLPSARSSFSSVGVFEDCSGGNSRPSRPSGVGGGTFLMAKLWSLTRAQLKFSPTENAPRSTLNVQRPMSKSAVASRMSWPLAFTLIALLIAVVVLIVFLRLETWPARTARQSTAELERLGKDLRAAFLDVAHLQPRITINNRVYMEQTTPVSELVYQDAS